MYWQQQPTYSQSPAQVQQIHQALLVAYQESEMPPKIVCIPPTAVAERAFDSPLVFPFQVPSLPCAALLVGEDHRNQDGTRPVALALPGECSSRRNQIDFLFLPPFHCSRRTHCSSWTWNEKYWPSCALQQGDESLGKAWGCEM